MKKTFLIVAALVSFTAFAFAGDVLGSEITIDVAPNVLNLQRTVDKCVTVHTDILYSKVDHYNSKVLLLVGNGYTEAYSCFSDDRGYFVAKFWREAVGDLVSVGYNTFTLTGVDYDGEEFSGTQDILVVDNVPINDPNGPR
ncbi:MAG: hypothetical protein PVF42_07270 [Desulfobacterales bacterium]